MPIAQGSDPTNVVGRRVVAWLIDNILQAIAVGVVVAIVGLPNIPVRGSTAATADAIDSATSTLLAAGLGVSLLLFVVRVITVGLFGWSFGQLFLGLRVVRYDGHPPGLGRGMVRCLVDGLGQGVLGCLYDIPALFLASTTIGHRQPADMAAGTYVIDSYYLGRLIIRRSDRVVSGPPAMRREEMEAALRAEGIDTPVFIPPSGRITEPFYDRNLGTQVVFSRKQNQWLRFDKKTESWSPIEGQPAD